MSPAEPGDRDGARGSETAERGPADEDSDDRATSAAAVAEQSPPSSQEASETRIVRDAVRAVRGGDRDAFEPLLDLYQRRLFGLALTTVRDPEGAEEVAQDAFLRAFTHLDRYDERRPFYPWLATIAVRLAQNWLRRRRRNSAREIATVDPERETARRADALDLLITDERDRTLWRLVAALPSGERTAVALHYRQGLKVREVADALGVTSGTVKTFLFRARKKLREALEDHSQTEKEK